MDPVSQGALGAAVALAVFSRRTKLSTGTVAWLGALSAMAPDLDVFIRSSSDSLLAVEYHRHFTHSLAFMPVGAAVALLPWLFANKVRHNLLSAYLVSLVGYGTHAPLDCATTYGTQFFWPFSSYRVSLSWVSVVDLAFTLPLLFSVIFAARRARGLYPVLGLIWGGFYIGMGATQKSRAYSHQERLLKGRGHQPTRRAVYGTFMNQIVFRSLYEHDGKIFADQIRIPYWGSKCVTSGKTLRVEEPLRKSSGPQAARGYRLVHWFSSGWVGRSDEAPSVLADARYSASPYGSKPFWGVTIDYEKDRAEWVNIQRKGEMGPGLFWKMITQIPSGSSCE